MILNHYAEPIVACTRMSLVRELSVHCTVYSLSEVLYETWEESFVM